MKVKALRGVCIGIEQHLVAGDTADLEPALVTFLGGIGAIEIIPDAPTPLEPQPEIQPEPKSKPKKSGKEEQ